MKQSFFKLDQMRSRKTATIHLQQMLAIFLLCAAIPLTAYAQNKPTLGESTTGIASTVQDNEKTDKSTSEQFDKNIVKYERVPGSFSEGLLPVIRNNHLGYINTIGEEVVLCRMKYFRSDYKSFLIMERGLKIDDADYGDFSDGLARISSFDGASGSEEGNEATNIRYGYIDKTGRMVIPCTYEHASRFSEGKAYVESKSFKGFIDKAGRQLFSVNGHFDSHEYSFSDGLVRIVDLETNKVYFYDGHGRAVLTIPMYRLEIREFHDGLAFCEEENWKGFIDKSGNHVIDCAAYQTVNNFSEGLAAVSKDGQTYGFIDTKGNIVIPISIKANIVPQYTDDGEWENVYEFYDFHCGLCRINKDGKWYFINKNNEVVIEVKEGVPSDMNEGVSLITKRDSKNKVIGYSILSVLNANKN